MRVRWIDSKFGFGIGQTEICVPAIARSSLLEMGGALAGTDGLVAIYIPEGTDDVYQVGNMRGRIVGAVRLLPMPRGRSIDDYRSFDWDEKAINPEWDGRARWPIGWPCQVILAPAIECCPILRSLVDIAHPGAPYGSYAAQFQHGPFRLGFEMGRLVQNAFSGIFGEPPWADDSRD